jgi:hypothetical protein
MYRFVRTVVAPSLPLLLALAGCDKDKPKDEPSQDASAEAEPKVAAKPTATLFTGDKVSLPAPYAGLKLGMTLDEAKAAVPGLPDDGTLKPAEYPDVWFWSDFDDDSKRLRRLYFDVPKAEAVEAMTKQWGAPKQATELNQEILVWFNPEAELRVSLADSAGDEATIEFTHYWPAAKFLGEGKQLGFENDAPLLGLSAADLEAKYPSYIKKTSAEQAAKRAEDIKKLAGEEAGALLGKPSADIDLEYPPLEWGKFWTPVHFMWTNEGTIRQVWFSLEYEPHPAAKDELFDLMKAKWGEPKEEKDLGDEVFVFSEDPIIKVKEDTISNAWGVFIEPKR